MLRKPCAVRDRASRNASSTESVTRRMGLSREKPQYLHWLMHSFERYSGANRRMTLPNRCCVSACERRPIASRNSPAAGEIRLAKSASASEDFARLSRTAAGLAARDFATSDGNGSELNSTTKLTKPTYQ